jgi:hypothetical protein
LRIKLIEANNRKKNTKNIENFRYQTLIHSIFDQKPMNKSLKKLAGIYESIDLSNAKKYEELELHEKNRKLFIRLKSIKSIFEDKFLPTSK